MPLPMMNFPMQTFLQANPSVAASGHAADLLSKAIENQKQAIAKKYLQPTLSEQLEKLRTETAFAPQVARADLSKKLAEERLHKAHANYYNMQARQHPEDLKLRRELLDFQKEKFANPNIMQYGRLLQTMPAEQRQAWLTEHPEFMELATALGGQISSQYFPGQGMPATQPVSSSGLGQGLGQGLGLGQPQQPPFVESIGQPQRLGQQPEGLGELEQRLGRQFVENIGQAQERGLGLGGMAPQQIPQAQERIQAQDEQPVDLAFTRKAGEADRRRLVGQIATNNSLVGEKIKSRADSAIAMDSWLYGDKNKEEFSRAIRSASKYAGISGKSQATRDALLRETPEAYRDYVWLKNVFTPNMDNQIRLMEGMGSTDKQTEILSDMVNTINWDVNPKASIDIANRLFKDMSSLSDSVLNAAEPIHKGARKRAAQLGRIQSEEPYIAPEAASPAAISSNAYSSQKNLEHTAKSRGMTVEQVRAELKKRGKI